MPSTPRHPLLGTLLLAIGLPACGSGSFWAGLTGKPRCAGAEDILCPDGALTGYVDCADGSIDKVSSETLAIESFRESCAGDEDERSCRTSEDECRANDECGEGPDHSCDFQTLRPEDGFTCEEDTCVEGRPLVVDQARRVAQLARGRSWWPATLGA